MFVYSYDKESKVYIGKEEADESPLEPGVYFLPLYATFQEPPKYAKYEIPVWKENHWEVVPIEKIYDIQPYKKKIFNTLKKKQTTFKWKDYIIHINTENTTSILASKAFLDNENCEYLYISAEGGLLELCIDEATDLINKYLLINNKAKKELYDLEKNINNIKTFKELDEFLEQYI